MRFLQISAAFLVVMMTASCGEPNVSEAVDDATEAGGDIATAGQAADIVDQAVSQVGAGLANNQFGIDTVKIVFRHFGTEEGQSTLWIEGFGARAATETDIVTKLGNFEEPNRTQSYWDGSRVYQRNLLDDRRFDIGIRPKNMEPAAVTITSPADLELVGYERMGEMTVAGKTCEHWRNPNLRYETCFWNRIELLSLNGYLEDGGFSLKYEAEEVVEGESIPDEIRALGG